MLDLSTWSRADIMSAIALLISSLAFIASGVSSLAAWLGYRASRSAIEPSATAFFEPFEAGSEWWILHVEINNRSPFLLEVLVLTFLQPQRARFSKYVGGYSGAASGNGPMLYTLPDEVNTVPSSATITAADLKEVDDFEVASQQVSELASLLVRMPPARVWRREVVIRLSLLQHLSFPRRKSIRLGIPFPTRQTVPYRY